MKEITNPKSIRRWWRRFTTLWVEIVNDQMFEIDMCEAGFHPIRTRYPKPRQFDWTPEKIAEYRQKFAD